MPSREPPGAGLELGEPKIFYTLYAKRVGPGAWKHRGARHLRRLRRMADTHQLDVEIRTARGLCAPVSRDLFKLSAAL